VGAEDKKLLCHEMFHVCYDDDDDVTTHAINIMHALKCTKQYHMKRLPVGLLRQSIGNTVSEVMQLQFLLN